MITADFFFCNTILDLIMVFFNIWVSQRIFKSKKSNTDKRIAIIHHFWIYLSWGKSRNWPLKIWHKNHISAVHDIYINMYRICREKKCYILLQFISRNVELIPGNVEHFKGKTHLFLTCFKFWHFKKNVGHMISLHLIW
jgi:hypothetical protein